MMSRRSSVHHDMGDTHRTHARLFRRRWATMSAVSRGIYQPGGSAMMITVIAAARRKRADVGNDNDRRRSPAWCSFTVKPQSNWPAETAGRRQPQHVWDFADG